MPAMDYLVYLEMIWTYFPYILYTFVFLTFLPKSIRRIKSFANADYETNRHKFHRCYSPDICCHALAEQQPKPKPRKPVTRVYPKRSVANGLESIPSATKESLRELPIKRQVPPSAIQTRTNVNLIAKMFETGTATTTIINGAVAATQTSASKKHNRRPPTGLPEIRTFNDADMHMDYDDMKSVRRSAAELLLLEDIENSANFLNQQQQQQRRPTPTIETPTDNWSSESITVQRRVRNTPKPLTSGDTSTTPSTMSPAASSPPSSSPHNSCSSTPSPVRRTAPFILKSSLEDIFAAIARNAEKNETFIYTGCTSLAPVTSIDDILSQRRLSRPLSAYSISDLLAEDNPTPGLDEAYVERLERIHR